MNLLLLFLIVFTLLALRQNMVLILLVSAAYVQVVYGNGTVLYVVEDLWTAMDNHALLAIPMYLVVGNLIARGSIAGHLVEVFKSATDWMPGGLGVATILACACFSAISGSSAATLIAIGSVMYPALKDAGYSSRFAIGSVTSAGTLGILIPPSIPLILYGLVTDTSVADLFLAGVLPGILLALIFAVYSVVTNREMARGTFSSRRLITSFHNGFFAILAPVLLLGGIYSGVFSPIQAAAVAVVYTAAVEVLIYRSFGLAGLFEIMKSSVVMLGTLMPIVAVALMLKSFLASEGLPDAFADWVQNIFESKVAILLALNLALLITGCLIDVVSAILLLAPVMLAVGTAVGVNPVHLGIIMVVNLEIGLLTPPVGLNLLIASRSFGERVSSIAMSVLPFVLLMLVVLMVVTFVPWLSLVLIE
ncbi:C4-dicarboxylate transporter, DctM subunit [Roseovarius marisflavi]|uniref:TRAP transporter large permease protein n=1 Tax=Roseovarius marisflavi TaxID=1054996 RepID=A0A1M7DPU5_9RHOB|nr:TRAP transporter large permease subunit [Roseovarius marisflavi]SHL81495.1 C4-dicarboxylate transporter, DctM subunit [Roseovarius marisflavi]